MKDFWHFLTKNDHIFTTRGNSSKKDFLVAAGLYKLDNNGKKILFGKKYTKEVDEFGNKWISKINPEYIQRTEYGQQIIVPLTDIKLFFNPFEISDNIWNKIRATKWKELLRILEEFIPKEDIGLIGSYLLGFPNEDSDLDLVVRGNSNLCKIKEKFPDILRKLNAKSYLDDYRLKISLDKYSKVFNSNRNDFIKMINNRWPTICKKEYLTKMRFAPKDNEIKFPSAKNKLKEIEIEGEVIEDLGTNFMPRFFKMKSKGKIFEVLTYFWDFTYCVKKGDIIYLSGSLFEKNTIVIGDREKHGILFK